jgi:hypothetical protein
VNDLVDTLRATAIIYDLCLGKIACPMSARPQERTSMSAHGNAKLGGFAALTAELTI